MHQDYQGEDPGRHCTQDQCAMYYATETTGYFANVLGGTIPRFEQFCTEDVAPQSGQ